MEAYLNAAISGNTENLPPPISRIDFLLCDLIDTIKTSEESLAAINTAILSKVDKEEGKSLVSDTEIMRLANVDNYDDTKVKDDISSLNTDIGDIQTILSSIVEVT